MTSFLPKIIVFAVLVQLAFGAAMQAIGCPDNVTYGTSYNMDGGCGMCICNAPDNSSALSTSQPTWNCYTCPPMFIVNCTEMEVVNPLADYPDCCEKRCKTE